MTVIDLIDIGFFIVFGVCCILGVVAMVLDARGIV